MTQIALKLAQLVASPHNVRVSPEDNTQLKQSLLHTGQVQPIAVVKNDAGQFEIVAGARRVQAFRDLVADGEVDGEVEIAAIVLESTRGDLTNVSLAENFIRLPMTVADHVTAIKRMADEEGLDAIQIGNRFGMSETLVRQRLALATLHPDVFAAFARNEMTQAVAQIFTIEPNPDRQLEIFQSFLRDADGTDTEWLENFEPLDPDAVEDLDEDARAEYDDDFAVWEKWKATADQPKVMIFRANEHQVRQAITEMAIRGSDPRALAIGVEEFVAAGGQIITDLFANDADGQLFTPAQLVNDLAEAKAIAIGEAIKAEQGIGFVIPVLRSYFSEYDHPGINRVYDETDWTAVPEVNRGRAVTLQNNGTFTADAMLTNKRPASSGSSSSSSNKAANALSERACSELAYMRRDIMRAELMKNPALAQSYLLFVDALKSDGIAAYSTEHGTTINRDFNYSDGCGHEQDAIFRQQPAADEFAELSKKLDRTWCADLKGSDPVGAALYKAFTLFRELPLEAQQLWAAFSVARALRTSANVNGSRGMQFHALLGRDMAIDVRSHFTPNEGNYFAYTSKAQMLALLDGFGETVKKAAKMKTPDLRAFMTSLAKGEGPPEDGAAAKHLLAWVPNELQFAKAEAKSPPAKAKAKPRAKKQS